MTDSTLKNALYRTLRGKPTPLFIFEDRAIPAASVWSGTRQWLNAMRTAGLDRGDRVVLALEPSPEWLMVALACLWDGYTLALACPGERPADAASSVQARLTISRRRNKPDRAGLPPKRFALDTPSTPPSERVALLLRTSGTTGEPRWIALSEANITAVLESHAPILADRPRTVLSVLPWHHAFGLVIDLLPAILGECTIVRDLSSGRDPEALLRLARQYECTSLSLVPMQVRALMRTNAGQALLRSLDSGTVGGAPVDAETAAFLGTTNLRPGYGLTEAGPGIALGTPGNWIAGAIGTPVGAEVGCETTIDAAGQLHFRGPNACLGEFENGILVPAPSGWRPTGDVVEPTADGSLRFLGRIDDDFKLGNGKMVRAAAAERALRRALPLIDVAVIPDGPDHIAVHATADEAAPRPKPDDIRAAIGPLGSRVRRVTMLASSDMPRTPKGAIDRRALANLELTEPIALAA